MKHVLQPCDRAPNTGTRLPGSIWFEDGRIFISPSLSIAVLSDVIDDRSKALISIALGRRVDARSVKTIQTAARVAQNGDRALAHLYLDIARLSRIPAPEALTKRLALAGEVLDAGTAPDDLMSALDDLNRVPHSIAKFDPEQTRVPAGSGRESGRWTSGNASATAGVTFAAPAAAAASEGASLFAPDVAAATLSALSALFAAVGAVATLGVLFVPWQKSVSSSGTLPGSAGATYDYDRDEGRLRIRDAAGSLLATGQLDGRGIFHDVITGIPIGRAIDGAIVFDSDAAHNRDEAVAGADAGSLEDADKNEPKLCPAPGPDQPGSEAASPRAKAYQEQISQLINGALALKYGLAINLINPTNGRIVHFDECDRSTGTMIEAKGPRFVDLLGFEPARTNVTDDWLDQSLREVQAAGARDVVWYFAEQGAADYARALFAEHRQGRERIILKVVPAIMQ